jgi:hypothetical protein
MSSFALTEDSIDLLASSLCSAVHEYMSSNCLSRLPNLVAFMIRPDSGMCYSHLLGPKLNREIGSIAFQSIEQRYYEISAAVDDASFEMEHANLIDAVRQKIRNALSKSPDLARLEMVLSQYSLTISTIEYDDMETEQPLAQ